VQASTALWVRVSTTPFLMVHGSESLKTLRV
jgi:hypothetical protein